MNQQKLDASLAAALEDNQDPDERNLSVFIHTRLPLDDDEAEVLKDLGIRGVNSKRHTYTATLSALMVEMLSDQKWIRALRLAQKLNLLPKAAPPVAPYTAEPKAAHKRKH